MNAYERLVTAAQEIFSEAAPNDEARGAKLRQAFISAGFTEEMTKLRDALQEPQHRQRSVPAHPEPRK